MEMLFPSSIAHTVLSLELLNPKQCAGRPPYDCEEPHLLSKRDDTARTDVSRCTMTGHRRPLSSLICELKSITSLPLRILLRQPDLPGQEELIDPRILARRARLLRDLDTAHTSKQRHRIHEQLYQLLGVDLTEESIRRESLYDAKLVKAHLLRLEDALQTGDPLLLLGLLRKDLKRDLGGILNPALYLDHHPGVPTEPTIARYQKAVLTALDTIVAACLSNDDHVDKHYIWREMKRIRKVFGNTALCCSGGGCLGMIHIGVIKALRDAGRLPRVISGSSAGAIVCAILCTRTEQELPAALEHFVHGDLAVFVGDDEDPGWLARASYYWKTGSAFDSKNLERVMKQHLGNMTFLEAYNKTGKDLNITVSTPKRDETAQRVLNRLNCPDVVIWSAVVASCALPLAFRFGRLMVKDPETKEIRPLHEDDDPDGQFKDGSFQGDIPLHRLTQDFGSTYFIVAQTNPHVLVAWRLRKAFGEGTLGKTVHKLSNIAVQEMCRVLPDLGYLGDMAASLLDQPYAGNITIAPELTFASLRGILSNPTPEYMDAARRTGEAVLEPYLPMIKNHVKMERGLEKACRDLREACHFSESHNDLRRLHLEHAARSRRRRGSTQSVPGFGSKAVRSKRVGGHRRSKTTPFVLEGMKQDQEPFTPRRSVDLQHTSDSSASERRAKFTLDFEDESESAEDDDSITSRTPPQDPIEDDDLDLEPDILHLHSRSAPSSPWPRPSNFVDPFESGMPNVPSFSLIMTPTNATPASERSVSPELKRSASPEMTRPAARGIASTASFPKKGRVQRPAGTSDPPPTSKSPLRHKRNSSTR